jgi:hypothetical protein
MKKLLTLLLSLALLAGCGNVTVQQGSQNYLDEKIKCKKLADEFLKTEPASSDYFQAPTSGYSPKLDTCLVIYDHTESTNLMIVHDLIANRDVELISYDDIDEYQSLQKEAREKYFGEDAE